MLQNEERAQDPGMHTVLPIPHEFVHEDPTGVFEGHGSNTWTISHNLVDSIDQTIYD